MITDNIGNKSAQYTVNGIKVLFFQPFNVTSYIYVNGVVMHYTSIQIAVFNFSQWCQIAGVKIDYDYSYEFKIEGRL